MNKEASKGGKISYKMMKNDTIVQKDPLFKQAIEKIEKTPITEKRNQVKEIMKAFDPQSTDKK